LIAIKLREGVVLLGFAIESLWFWDLQLFWCVWFRKVINFWVL